MKTFALIVLFAAAAYAIPAPVEVSAPSLNVAGASTFTVPITVSDADGIFAFQFNIVYDPNVITPVGDNFGCSTEGTMAVQLTPVCNVYPQGVLRTAVYGAYPMGPGESTVLNITFVSVSKQPGYSPLAFENVFFFNAIGLAATDSYDGAVTILKKKSRPRLVPPLTALPVGRMTVNR